MDSSEMWMQYQGFIIGKAKELHKIFPNVLELNEKISIAWLFAEQARKSYDEKKGKFTTYSGKAITLGLFKAINKEISFSVIKENRTIIGVVVNDNIDNYADGLDNSMLLDDKMNSLLTIEKSLPGKFAWSNKIKGITIKEIAKENNITASKVFREIKKFQRNK